MIWVASFDYLLPTADQVSCSPACPANNMLTPIPSGLSLRSLSLFLCAQLQLFGKAPTPSSSPTSSPSPSPFLSATRYGRQTLDTWQQTEWWKLSQRWWWRRRRRRATSRRNQIGCRVSTSTTNHHVGGQVLKLVIKNLRHLPESRREDKSFLIQNFAYKRPTRLSPPMKWTVEKLLKKLFCN